MAIIDSSEARTANAGGTVFKGKRSIVLFQNITAVSGTDPTCVVKLQTRDRAQNVWVDVPGAAFTSKAGVSSAALFIAPHLTAAANAAVPVDLTGLDCRLYWTIGGTATPTFTFSHAVITQD